MSLNIKNEAVHDLVREAAVRTGASRTSVVDTAVRRTTSVTPDVRSALRREP